MGSVGFSTIVDNVERNIGNRTDLETQVGTAVNQAYRDVVLMKVPRPGGGYFYPIDYCYSLHTSATLTVASGNQSFALTDASGGSTAITDADQVLAIYQIRDTTNKKPLEGPINHRDLMEKDVTQTGTPSQYSRFGNSIYFNRTTDASTAYQVYYYRRPTTLSGSTATVIPIEYDYAVELRATQIILETPLHETDHAAEYAAQLVSWMQTRCDPEALAAEDLDFGMVPTRSGTSNTNRAWSWSRARNR